ncbi:MAG: DUF192 domain-containing protein [Limnothrix sp. RL_2_0]|nr:DUF192 domain-containing protein [Limnothrix sp. RL_2_0]
MNFNHRFLSCICGLALIGCTPLPVEETNPETTTPSTATVSSETTFKGQILPITATAKVKSLGKVFNLEVADTAEKQRIGLMYREELADDRGMLFEFDPARPVSFWMKNCLINLDMIFLKDGVVQSIAKDVPPCESEPCPTYGTPKDIDQVIEIRGGLSDEIGIKEGHEITVTFIES